MRGHILPGPSYQRIMPPVLVACPIFLYTLNMANYVL